MVAKEICDRLIFTTFSDIGFTHMDPVTGIEYTECDTCHQVCGQESYHGEGECVFCFAAGLTDVEAMERISDGRS